MDMDTDLIRGDYGNKRRQSEHGRYRLEQYMYSRIIDHLSGTGETGS